MFEWLLSKLRKKTKKEDGTLPIPPLELRRLVGPTDVRAFDNPSGGFIWGDLDYGALEPGEVYQRVFDFGCGCGRQARQLLMQHQPPERYVGVDISRAMIKWCQQNLARPGVEFYHHDVWSPNPCYAPDNSRNPHLPLRQYGQDFTLINAFSVFTHLLEPQARFYLKELRSMLSDRGVFQTTWFLFNRDWFPILNPDQHCIYVNAEDPTQAVYYDWNFLKGLFRESGLKLVDVTWNKISGHQHKLMLAWGPDFQDIAETIEPSDKVLGFGYSAPL